MEWSSPANEKLRGDSVRSYKTDYAPDDPGVWHQVTNFFPTPQGTYATAKQYSAGQSMTATGELAESGYYAYCFSTTTTYAAWLGTTSKIWRVVGALTDATGGVATGTSKGVMCQYGDLTILATGSGGSELAAATASGSFATFATGLKADFIVTQSNCLLAFSTAHASLTSTGGDAWAASDVGDYTNFTPGAAVEAANGRLLQTPGKVTGAIAFAGSVYAFKRNAIYRGTYVGGAVKWQWELVHVGVGMAIDEDWARRAIISCRDVIVFPAHYDSAGRFAIYAFDGVNVRRLNKDVSVLLSDTSRTALHYDARLNQLRISGNGSTGTSYCYSFDTDQWGTQSAVNGVSIIGDYADVSYMFKAINASFGYPAFWNLYGPIILTPGTNTVTIKSPTTAETGVPYTSTIAGSMVGTQNKKTTFKSVYPILRSRSTVGSGTPSVTAQINLYTEKHDTSASRNLSLTEDTTRDRFPALGTDTYGRPYLFWVNTAIEIDDLLMETIPAGTD